MASDGIPDMGNMLRDKLEDALKERGRMNILIAGRSGVGKSTLINAVFQGNLATTGQGRPVTTGTREITKEGVPVSIWDTRGLEMEAFSETIADLQRLISERRSDLDPQRHIHVAWVCVHEDGRRVESAEIALHEMLAQHLPVIAVVTKARSDNGFSAVVQELLPNAKNVVRVRALQEALDDGPVLPAFGLGTLVEATAEVLPEGHQRAFAAAQKASIAQKRRASQKAVVTAVAAAVSAAAAPIPFSDAFLLVPIQVGMLASISVTFGLEVSHAFLSTLVAAAGGAGGAALVGRTLVSSVLKLFPGAGSVAGGFIAASTAGALTTALGELYIEVLVQLYNEGGGEPPTLDAVATAFKSSITRT